MKHTTGSFLITPARLFMSRFRYAQKFILIGLLFVVPLLVTSYLVVKEVNNYVELYHRKLIGVQHIYNIQTLLRDTQRHRGLSAVILAGDNKRAEQRAALQMDIARDLTVIMNYYNATYREDIGFGGTPAQHEHIERGFEDTLFKWDELRGKLNSFRSAGESFRAHTDYTRTVLALIRDVSDISGISTEERLINNYLAEMTVITLPELSEYIGRARAYGLGIPFDREITDEERYQFISLSFSIQELIKDLDRGTRIIFQEQPELEPILAPQIHNGTEALSSFLAVSQKEFVDGRRREVTNDAYWDISTQAIDSVLSVYNTLITTFTVRASTRVTEITRERNIIIGFSVGTLFLAVYFLIGFYTGVQRTLTTIQQTTDTMLRDGVYRGSIPVVASDELGDIAESFNRIINALGSANATLTRVNDNLSESMIKRKKVEDELRARAEEVDKFNRLMIGRELRMIELKEEVLKLKESLREKGTSTL